MASWKEERDRLVAQTLAFVQHIAATHPESAHKLGIAKPPASVAEEIPLGPIADTVSGETDTEQHVVGHLVLSPQSPITADLSGRVSQYASRTERAEIMGRVAAFKARQMALHRARETHYEEIQARIRSTLRNDSSTDRL